MKKQWANKRWGDDDEESGEVKETQAPAVVAAIQTPDSVPEENGERTIVEYTTDVNGRKVKVTRRVKLVPKTVKLNKHVLARRAWKKFGDCAGKAGPEENITTIESNPVFLNLTMVKEEETKVVEKSLDDAKVTVCRHCGESGHWTLKCPKRKDALPPSMQIEREREAAAESTSSTGKYTIPNKRGGVRARPEHHEEEVPALRVTNLPDEITDQDLQDLFRPFGHTTRIFLAKNRANNTSRGFAFINFTQREDAQRAIDSLHGHGYSSLILHVEWAKPRDDK